MTDALDYTLLRPLWGIVASFINRAELWMLAEISVFRPYHDPTKIQGGPDSLLTHAAAHGMLNVLAWQKQIDAGERVVLTADADWMAYNSAQSLTWRWPWNWTAVLSGAFTSPTTETLDWCVANGWDVTTALIPTPLPDFEPTTLDWRVTNIRYEGAERTSLSPPPYMKLALANQHTLEHVRWLRSRGCEWPADTATSIAESIASDALEIMQWARTRGPGNAQECEWGEDVTAAATRRATPDMLAWLRSGDDPCPWESYNAYSMATTVATLDWIYFNTEADSVGVPGADCVFQAPSVEMLRWFIEEYGLDWPEDVCCVFAVRGELEKIQHAWSSGQSWEDRSHILNAASVYDHLDIILWVRSCESTRGAADAPLTPHELDGMRIRAMRGNCVKVLAWLGETYSDQQQKIEKEMSDYAIS